MIRRLLILAGTAIVTRLAAPSNAASTIMITNVWSRPATETGVVYATIRNSASRADALVSASSPVAEAVELHESVQVAAPPAMSSGSMGHMYAMAMHAVRGIPIPADGSTELKPGGYHIMLAGLRSDLKAGGTFPITLRFQNAGVLRAIAHVMITQ